MRFRGLLFAAPLLLVGVCGGVVFLFPGLFLLPLSARLSRRAFDAVIPLWMLLVPALLELLSVKVKVSGDVKVQGPCLIVMNHRTRFDWLFLWAYIKRVGDLTRHKIILKASLKHVPIFGWAMQAGQFIFLSRRWEADEAKLKKSLAYFAHLDYPIQLLIFPEGTDLSLSNKEKSHRFAEKNGLPRYDYVLHPRSKGFVSTMVGLASGQSQPSILDISVGYLGSMPQNERDIAAGRLPTEIHFHGEWVPSKTLPWLPEELAAWLQQRWKRKENILRQFYAVGHFEGPYASEAKWKVWPMALGVVLAWTLYCTGALYLLYSSALLCYGFVAFNALLFALCHLGTGLDGLVLRRAGL